MDLRPLLLYISENPPPRPISRPIQSNNHFFPNPSISQQQQKQQQKKLLTMHPAKEKPAASSKPRIDIIVQDPVSVTSEALSNGLTSSDSFSFSNGFSFGGGTHSRRRLAASGSNAYEKRSAAYVRREHKPTQYCWNGVQRTA